MYRKALARAAEARGWSVYWYDRERVFRDTAADKPEKCSRVTHELEALGPDTRLTVTSAELRYGRVLPLYDALGVEVKAVLTDNGREYCGRPDRHPYELFLQLRDIEHRTTKGRSPRTNGFVERMNRALLDECFRVAGRTTWYVSLEEIQRDLDRFLSFHNLSEAIKATA